MSYFTIKIDNNERECKFGRISCQDTPHATIVLDQDDIAWVLGQSSAFRELVYIKEAQQHKLNVLSAWARDNLPEPLITQFFNIVANGKPEP